VNPNTLFREGEASLLSAFSREGVFPFSSFRARGGGREKVGVALFLLSIKSEKTTTSFYSNALTEERRESSAATSFDIHLSLRLDGKERGGKHLLISFH